MEDKKYLTAHLYEKEFAKDVFYSETFSIHERKQMFLEFMESEYGKAPVIEDITLELEVLGNRVFFRLRFYYTFN